MEKLYKINVTHYAPKGSNTAIKEFVVAESDKEVFNYLANGYAYWNDIMEFWDDEGYESEEDARETLNEIFNNKGDNRELNDLYYGATQYSWEEVELCNDEIIELMIENDLAKNIISENDINKCGIEENSDSGISIKDRLKNCIGDIHGDLLVKMTQVQCMEEIDGKRN